MKILFWILALLSIFVGWFMSFLSHMMNGLGLSGTIIGDVVCIAGMLSLGVCVIGVVLGIIKLRKGDVKKAIVFALAGIIYCGVIFGGLLLDDAVHTMKLNAAVENYENKLYGEGWDAPSAIVGIPEQYQRVLNEFYVVVRDKWPADQLMDLGAVSMSGYYGDKSTDNIGFALMDLNGDNMDELVIGTTAPVEEGGTAVFCVYTDASNPFYAISSVEGEMYYLHPGDAEGTYEAEIAEADAAWVIAPAQAENTFDFDYREGAMEPADRMTLDLIPFSKYK